MGQRIGILAAIRPDGDAYTAGDVGDAGLQFEGRGEIIDDPSGNILDFGLSLYLGQNNGEFVTAETGHSVGLTHCLLQTTSSFDQ